MTDDRKAGIALIAGIVGGLVTMVIHPVRTADLTPAQYGHLAFVSGVAHSLAIVSFVLLFLGAVGLTRKLSAPDRLAFSALITFGLAAFAIIQAAAVSGFIGPAMMKDMIRDTPDNTRVWEIIINAFFEINQAFAKIYTVAASAAIILWSASALQNGGLGRWKAIYGCLVSPLLIFGIASGLLKLNVHGMGLIVIAQALWIIPVGAELCQDQEPISNR